MKRNKKAMDDRYIRIMNLIDKAYGFEKDKNITPPVQPKKIEYLFGTYFPTGQEPKNFKPPFDTLTLN